MVFYFIQTSESYQAWFTFTLFHFGFLIWFHVNSIYTFNPDLLVSLLFLVYTKKMPAWYLYFGWCLLPGYPNYLLYLHSTFIYLQKLLIYFIGSLILCCILESWYMKLDPYPGLRYTIIFLNWFS
jgi:hypothetical protein